ncbi:MAG: hypothetical protein H0V58_07630 [Actinobacteria bacterium]|nr:hypothetical protein [Actinomycetota bacterium]
MSRQSRTSVAVPAIEAYQSDNSTYVGMTVPLLQVSYSQGVQGIEIVSAGASAYCVRSTIAGRSWYLSGPGGTVTTTACA